MNINIGEKIKNYRQKKDFTQEQLAESLHISFQAISKWERGEAYPDITMIPRLAYFFNTTTDDLLCYEQIAIEEEIKDYLSRHSKMCTTDDTRGALAVMREANEKYPGNFKLMQMLCFAIGWNKNNVDEEQRKKDGEEILAVSKKIFAECTDNSIRAGAFDTICSNLKELGQKDKAIELINKELPDEGIYFTKNMMLTDFLEGDELIRHRQKNLVEFLSHCIGTMYHLAQDFEPGAKLAVYENMLKMYEVIFTDGDYHYYNLDLRLKYMDMADICLNKNDYDRVLGYIEKAKDCAVVKDTLSVPTRHTSPLVDKLEYSGVWKNHTHNNCYDLLQSLKRAKYDAICGSERFRAVMSELEKYAKDKE